MLHGLLLVLFPLFSLSLTPTCTLEYSNTSCLEPGGVGTYFEAQISCMNRNGSLPLSLNAAVFKSKGVVQIYDVWIDSEAFKNEQSGTNCVIMGTDGRITNANCSERHNYLCVIQKDEGEVGQTCDGSDVTPYDSIMVPACALGSQCPNNWFVLAVVAVSTDSYYSSLHLLDQITNNCGTSSTALLLTPPTMDTNKIYCHYATLTNNYFTATGMASFNPETYVNVTADTVLELFEQAENCTNGFPFSSGGKVVYVLLDSPCDTLCSGLLPQRQKEIIDHFVTQGFEVEFLHLNDTNQCLRNIFSQCGAYNRAACEIQPFSPNVDNADLQMTLGPCEKTKSTSISTGLLVTLIILSILSTLGLIIICILRYKLKKEGGWITFWRSQVAVKRVPPHAENHTKKEFLEEVGFMKRLGVHSHILGVIGCITTIDLPLIVLELCELGDLLGFVRSKTDTFSLDDNGVLNAKELVSIAWQISDGLSYLKSKGLIHRDNAARNVLLTKELTAKISDFGLCRHADSSVYLSKGGRLPIKWMAMESLSTNSFSYQSDIWSFGILLWEVFSLGLAPYPSIPPSDVLDLLQKGDRLPRPEKCPEIIYHIMKSCWIEDPKERIDIEKIKSFFGGLLDASSIYYGYVELPSSVAICERNSDEAQNVIQERLV